MKEPRRIAGGVPARLRLVVLGLLSLRLAAPHSTPDADAVRDHNVEPVAVLVREHAADTMPEVVLALLLRGRDDVGVVGWSVAHGLSPLLLEARGSGLDAGCLLTGGPRVHRLRAEPERNEIAARAFRAGAVSSVVLGEDD